MESVLRLRGGALILQAPRGGKDANRVEMVQTFSTKKKSSGFGLCLSRVLFAGAENIPGRKPGSDTYGRSYGPRS